MTSLIAAAANNGLPQRIGDRMAAGVTEDQAVRDVIDKVSGDVDAAKRIINLFKRLLEKVGP